MGLFYFMSKDTFYFSHDYNSRNDEKIKFLIRKHGLLGYGLFWSIIEDLYNNANALRTDYEGIAYDYRIDVSIVTSVINDFDLFVFDAEHFGSLSVQKRIDERDSKSVKARESAHKRWTNANAMQSQCEGNAIKERKGKEINEKKVNKVNIIDEQFEEFWDLYDYKKSRDKAEKAWKTLNKEEKALALQHAPVYAQSTPDKQFRKHPTTYLNSKSFNDEIIERTISTKLSYAELEWERLKNLG
jgi:cell fate (sporulation/competence/biofilm development) regulator YlbF (YheA/YmcA/DUF963 family)